MAYADYIHCNNCDCKLIYDGYCAVADSLEEKWGNVDADDYTVKLLCPDCLKMLERERDEARAEVVELQSTGQWLALEYERLSKAIEDAPWFGSNKKQRYAWDKWKRDALGGNDGVE